MDFSIEVRYMDFSLCNKPVMLTSLTTRNICVYSTINCGLIANQEN